MLSTIVWVTRPLVSAAKDYPAYTIVGLGVVWAGMFCYTKMSISSANICAKPLSMQHSLYHKKKDLSIQVYTKAILVSKIKSDVAAITSSAQAIALQILSLNQHQQKKAILIGVGCIAAFFVCDILQWNRNFFRIPIVLVQGIVVSLMFTLIFYYLSKSEQQASVSIPLPSQPTTDSLNLIREQQKALFEKIKTCLNQIQRNKQKISYHTKQIESTESDNLDLLKKQYILQKEFEEVTTVLGNELNKKYTALMEKEREAIEQMKEELKALEAHAT